MTTTPPVRQGLDDQRITPGKIVWDKEPPMTTTHTPFRKPTPCGCATKWDGPAFAGIDYCPTHAQAPAMLALLHRFATAGDGQALVDARHEARAILRAIDGNDDRDASGELYSVRIMKAQVEGWKFAMGQVVKERDALTKLADALAAAVLDNDCGLVNHQDLVACERDIIAKAKAYRDSKAVQP
jgi:hypothetical protein